MSKEPGALQSHILSIEHPNRFHSMRGCSSISASTDCSSDSGANARISTATCESSVRIATLGSSLVEFGPQTGRTKFDPGKGDVCSLDICCANLSLNLVKPLSGTSLKEANCRRIIGDRPRFRKTWSVPDYPPAYYRGCARSLAREDLIRRCPADDTQVTNTRTARFTITRVLTQPHLKKIAIRL